jgi:hypothetical protein
MALKYVDKNEPTDEEKKQISEGCVDYTPTSHLFGLYCTKNCSKFITCSTAFYLSPKVRKGVCRTIVIYRKKNGRPKW